MIILEALKANVPTILFDSEHNRESSALPYLLSAMNSDNNPPGVFAIESIDRLAQKVSSLIQSKQLIADLSRDQVKLLNNLEGRNILFAKDYLNYLLDINLSIQSCPLIMILLIGAGGYLGSILANAFTNNGKKVITVSTSFQWKIIPNETRYKCSASMFDLYSDEIGQVTSIIYMALDRQICLKPMKSCQRFNYSYFSTSFIFGFIILG